MDNDPKGYFWPTQEQELLLKATLYTGGESIVAWKNWAAAVDFDKLDYGSQRLLPLLYKNLANQNVDHPALNIYKGFYRMTWYRNRLLRHRITSVLCLLNNINIPVLLLKGAAIAPLYYRDWALRPMNDFDLHVPQKDALKAIDLLCRSGWKTVEPAIDESDLQTRHSAELVDPSGIALDLHWRIMPQSGPDDDFNFINSTEMIDFDNIRVSVLSHTDQLFHILVHGARWNEVAPLRWIPDSMMIIRTAQPLIDWERMVKEARFRCTVIPLAKTLLYLHETFSAPVPKEIISGLKQLKPSLTERLDFLTHSRSRSFFRDIFYLWFMHLRSSGAKNNAALIYGFPSFLRRFWKVPPEKSLAVFLIRKLADRADMIGATSSNAQSRQLITSPLTKRED